METLVISILILSPIEISVPRHVSESYWKALKNTAADLQLSGPSCVWNGNFRSEVGWIRKNFWEAKDYPSISECHRLPDFRTCCNFVFFNDEHRCFIEEQQKFHLNVDLLDYLRETSRLHCFWLAAINAQNESRYWVDRRRSLKEIKDMVGDEAWFMGNWPPPVPLWRWEIADWRRNEPDPVFIMQKSHSRKGSSP